jgi:hypothetical protein
MDLCQAVATGLVLRTSDGSQVCRLDATAVRTGVGEFARGRIVAGVVNLGPQWNVSMR